VKRVESVDPTTLECEVLATFTLVGDLVVCDFRDADFQRDLEINGIYTIKAGEVRPDDGRAFYDALDDAYARSSFVHVVTTD